MKKVIILTVLSTLFASCKNTNSTSEKSQVSLPFESRAFSLSEHALHESSLRKKLLHEIFLAKKDLAQLEENKIISDDLAVLSDDLNYNKNFAKLIVSYADHEELFYVKEGTPKEAVINLLNLKLEAGKNWVWKSEIKRGGNVYLIETSEEEVLQNEKSYSIASINKLSTIFPYQRIEVSIQPQMQTPAYTIENSSVKRRGCLNPEAPELCYCNYARKVPTGGMTAFENINRESIVGELIVDNKEEKIIFQNTGVVLQAVINSEVGENDVQTLKISLPSEESFAFTSVPNNCGFLVGNQNFGLKNYLQYKISYKVFGANETIKSFGILPQQIN